MEKIMNNRYVIWIHKLIAAQPLWFKFMKKSAKPTLLELARESLQDVEGGYDLLAPKFDHSRYRTPESILKPFFQKLKAEVGPVAHAMDLCCGTGAASLHLLPLCEASFTALDLSEGMLEQCQAKIMRLRPGIPVKFVKADALEMPFSEDFDLIVSFGAFGHIPRASQTRFIEQVFRALKPGGHFAFITTTQLPWWSLSLWRQRLFNALIHLRNLLIKPPFIMYYLTFQLPEVQSQLEAAGFRVRVFDELFSHCREVSDLMPIPYFRMVLAQKLPGEGNMGKV